ncbi:MAG: oligosaccharide flippase family protein [Melioribacteraceae bacterium]|nr:oligosaccharide flippase family protein [Melioribacteraceae bacterium]
MITKLFGELPLSDKFKSDTVLNVVSLGLFGLTGLVLSFLISKFYNPGVLGIFNINFALLIILSQIAGGGIHYFSLVKVAELQGDKNAQLKLISSSLLSVLLVAGIITLLLFLIRNWFSFLYDHQHTTFTIIFILPGIFFLAVNKVLLSYFNALQKMKIFALANIIRAVTIFAGFSVFLSMELSGEILIVLFSLSELLVFITFIWIIREIFTSLSLTVDQFKSNLLYGVKALSGSIFFDANTKVDIIMLGLMVSDREVGLYSLPALMIEGFHQLPIVLRNMINPKLTRIIRHQTRSDLVEFISTGKSLVYKFLMPIGIFTIPLLYLAIKILNINEEYYLSLYPLLILLAGSLVSVGYQPFIMVLNQAGKPFQQSIIYFLVFIFNVIMNAVLIPWLSYIGAAIATSLSFILIVILLKIYCRRFLLIKI